jgi:hypothetical protein
LEPRWGCAKVGCTIITCNLGTWNIFRCYRSQCGCRVQPCPPAPNSNNCSGEVGLSRKSDRLRVFYFLVVHPDPISAASLSEQLDLNQREVTQHLTVLKGMGFVINQEGGKKANNPTLWSIKKVD